MSYDKFPKAARKLSTLEKIELVKEVREHVDDGYSYDRENRREAMLDLRFVAGDQWPEAVKAERLATGRPMLTVNRLPQFLRQITNPTRDADIAMKASPVGDVTDPQVAKIYNQILTDIQYRSTAKTVYVMGNEHQAACGIGWWQVITRYVDDGVFDQEIVLESVTNPMAVICDPAAVLPDRSDAMWMVLIEHWPRKKFKRCYPKSEIAAIEVPDAYSHTLRWSTPDVVAVANYYRKVPVKKKLALHQSGETTDITGMGEAELGQLDQADGIVQTRDVDCYRVEKYLVTGEDVLEGPINWAGKYIPLVPVIGAETPLPIGQMRYGIVRFARDPQQMLNFYRTATAEAIALAPKTPYVVTMTQIGPYKELWDTLNKTNRPYLLYDPDPLAPGMKPQRDGAPEPPAALIHGAEEAGNDLKTVTGVYDATLGAKSNETSGVAIARRDAQGDNANSHFADNLVHSLVHTGRICIDLIPHIYDNERQLRLMDSTGVEQQITINKVLYTVDGQPIMQNDLSQGRFDVRVTVGRGYATKRIEALNAMLEFAKSLPPQAQILLLDMIAKNSDWPDSEEVAKRFRTLVPAAALADPNDPNAPKPPGPMDDPMMVAKLEEMAGKIELLKEQVKAQAALALKTIEEANQLAAQTDQIQLPTVTGDWQSILSSGEQAQP